MITFFPAILAQVPAGQTYQTLLNMQPAALFQSVLSQNTTVLTGLRSLAQMFGAVFLILGHAERAKADYAHGQAAWTGLIKTGILTVLMFGGGYLLGFMAEAMNGAPAAIGISTDTPGMLAALYSRGVAMPAWSDMLKPLTGNPATDSATAAGATEAAVAPPAPQQGVFMRIWTWTKTHVSNLLPTQLLQCLAGFFVRLATAVSRLIVTSFLMVVMFFVVVLGMMLTWGMESLRYFCLLIGACLLPLFIGFISSGKMNEAGWKYVTQMIGLTTWPLGWAICNSITLELFDMSVRVLSGDAAIANQVTLISSLTTQGQSATWAQFSNCVMTASPMAFVMGLGLFIFTCCWMIFSSIMGPILINKTLVAGEELAFSAMSSNARVMSKAAGEVASMAAKAAIFM
jgi:hypothetical protein